jgi:anti-sigma factor RsiW
MNCPLENREDAQWLLDYRTGTLKPEAEATLEEHIATCGACREFARGQRAVWEALDGWEAAPVSTDFDRRLYRRMEAEVSWWDLLVRPFRSTFGTVASRRTLAAMAAACLLLTAGILLENPAISPAPVPTDMAQADTVQPEQVERTLDAMEMLNEFSRHVSTDRPGSKL